ncbi:MAG: GTPase Era [Lachnospiraceae bacterium]|nr:GTPase Era [Lachnospiraceae bacterium]
MSDNTEKKSGFAVLIGRPNVGKSTLMNHLIGQKIAITSPRPQTTRNRIQTVYTDDRGQVIFVDTPGLHKAKNKLGDYMMAAANRSIKEADIVLWLIEPDKQVNDRDMDIAGQIKDLKLPVFLVINKIDTVKKPVLLEVIEAYRKLLDFNEIIPVSALKSEGLDDLMKSVFEYLPVGPYYFDEDELTDQPMRQIVSELIREKTLRLLDKEIPHGIAVVIDSMKKRDGKNLCDIDATIICEKNSHKGIIIGKNGAMLKTIGSQARPEIEKLLEMKVNLKLWVKVKENWRDSDLFVSNFGYNKNDFKND